MSVFAVIEQKMEGRRIIADQCSAGVKPTTFISQVLNKNCPLSSNLHSSIVKKSYCYRKNGKACINCIFKALFGVVISKFNLPGVQPKMAANILNVFSSTFSQSACWFPCLPSDGADRNFLTTFCRGQDSYPRQRFAPPRGTF